MHPKFFIFFHKSYYDDLEASHVVENNNLGYTNTGYHPNIMSPFYPEIPEAQKTEKLANNPFLQQINQEFTSENDPRMQDEGFNFQRFYDNDSKLTPNGFFEGGANQEPKKKTKGSFKNTYINKINHLMKNNKNKPNTNEEQPPNK